MEKKKKFFFKGFIAVLALTLLTIGSAYADIQLNNLPESVESISIGGSTEQFYLFTRDAFGVDGEDYQWVDAAFKFNTKVKFKSDVEAKFGAIYVGTFGEDYYGSEYSVGALPVKYEGDNSSRFDVDEAWLKFNHLAGMPVDVTIGKQRIKIEKSFLMDDQGFAYDSNVYGNSIKSSPFGVLAEIHLDPITISAYGAKIGIDDDMAELLIGEDVDAYGINFHYELNSDMFVYAGVIDYMSETDDVLDDESITYYLGADVSFSGFNFQGEFAKQTGDESVNGADRDAEAGFAFLKYTFEKVPMTPFVELGGYFFSGDDPDTDDNEAFNTMTIGLPDWGKWVAGEIYGEQVYFGQSNYRTLSAQVGFMPKDYLSMRLQYFQTSWLEEDNVFGMSVSDEKASDEFNLLIEFFPNEKIYAGIILGVATPDTGLKEVFGDDKTSTVIMPFLIYNF